MKTLILGDIHGRTCWKQIIKEENPDFVIFLGDYVTTHDDTSVDQQVNNFLEIIEYKKSHLDSTILLWGNHDCQMMGYSWAEMSGWDYHLYHELSKINFKDLLLEFGQLAYIQDNVVYSHAGISKYWLENISHCSNLQEVCTLQPDERLAYNYDTGYGGGYGDSISQSPIWIRPASLINSLIDGITQVVGHTPVVSISNVKELVEECTEIVYLCDNLPNEYLINENNQFTIKKIN